jgi:hypothetical protein
MSYTMESYLGVVSPYLHSDLVSPTALSHIYYTAQNLPPFSFAILECYLEENKSRVDMEVGFSHIPSNLSANYLENPNWQIFQEICQEWTEPNSFLSQRVKNIWLEFDIIGQKLQMPDPCIFFGLNQEIASNSQDLIGMASKLLNQQISPELESNIQLSMNSFTSIHYLGAMLSRSKQNIRIVANKINPRKLLDNLVEFGWKYPIDPLQSLVFELSEFVDSICLSYDIGEIILPRIGLECFLDKQPSDEPRWQLFLDYLVDKGLCTASKKNAILAWTGFCQKSSQPDLWPKNLTWADSFLGSKALSIFSREISHIKVVYQPNSALEAKVYLWFGHGWVATENM